MYLLEFNEITKEVIWGGNSLSSLYSKPFDKNKTIGESWEICDLPNDNSIVSNGEFKGKTLSYLVNEYGEKLLGTKTKEKHFPLLIKIIDSKDKLSIQVHPDEEYANKRHNKHGKNEMWYVMETYGDAKLLIGIKEGFSKEDLKKKLSNNENIENMFNYFDIKKGDAFYIPSGCIHAILGNAVITEIQTPSDVTYRLYDWNRVDKNGKSRELHIEDAFNVIRDINAFDLKSNKQNRFKNEKLEINTVFSNDCFTVEEYTINEYYSSKTNNETFEIIMVLEGKGHIESNITDNIIKLNAGKTVLIPAALGDYFIKTYDIIKMLRVTL
ncbi:type I phosphomannose isomerase catalytic subunit [Brachyspira hyodysenteriae]|uniref:type I phosphomannose isomerase catalytic subunit n=1 Tax=Brachyspira hyodysenteriae TaxID=159 RepID=UPI00063DB6CA|nr:type I phosphomannose isomerase catalytic subunit [Brachyspira hyodysenteriae]KLI25222.1 mannose-6-phosphate isomerase [Brachyspira hyodysenteriae]KLI36704.1 mannose-6-phosphate isomerase [Brachyspira hyodysenteriae]KLI58618.1 mannose-6-phosphate isomerase [Brachyspira hyodysenteriae]TVL39959.1 mannose-6-phosphate isomerase [Brachyspira hyodysenteriae]TVL59301.1 mannose-6-phosphate isomerase [Brachyspira hyodysenteriae]